LADKKADVQNEKQIGYHIFLDYLDTWFFNKNATFNPVYFADGAHSSWRPHDSQSYLACLKKFKHSYLLEHEERVHNSNLHQRRSTETGGYAM